MSRIFILLILNILSKKPHPLTDSPWRCDRMFVTLTRIPSFAKQTLFSLLTRPRLAGKSLN